MRDVKMEKEKKRENANDRGITNAKRGMMAGEDAAQEKNKDSCKSTNLLRALGLL
jgi:hypothetical protein